LLEALLTLARSEYGRLQREPIDLATTAAQALRAHDHHRLTSTTALEPARTTGDPQLIERLVANLVDNAVRHNVPGGRLDIATHTAQGRATLTIANTGPRIPADEVTHLFQHFQRLSSHADPTANGVGLGLAIVQAIANAHDATGGPPAHGAQLRGARKSRGMTIKELATRVGISPAALSALERGEAAVSSAIIARIADALLVPMSALASSKAPQEAIIWADTGPTTVNRGGVTWQELGAPGHDMEPAILTVPPGEGSGGSYSRAGETFVLLQDGGLAFRLWSPEARAIELTPGDALTIPARTTFEWHNAESVTSRALWVESLISRPVAVAAKQPRRSVRPSS
jgi:transcriptional regulator with XRE-family HTH domain